MNNVNVNHCLLTAWRCAGFSSAEAMYEAPDCARACTFHTSRLLIRESFSCLSIASASARNFSPQNEVGKMKCFICTLRIVDMDMVMVMVMCGVVCAGGPADRGADRGV